MTDAPTGPPDDPRHVAEIVRLRAENKRLAADLRAAVDGRTATLSTVLHDLRNPLNAFATSLALLEALLPETQGTVRRTLDAMERSVQHMNRLLDELQDAARGNRGR